MRRNCEFLNAQIEDRKQRRQDEVEKELRKLELEKEAELAYQKSLTSYLRITSWRSRTSQKRRFKCITDFLGFEPFC